jgi:hypothetical protein
MTRLRATPPLARPRDSQAGVALDLLQTEFIDDDVVAFGDGSGADGFRNRRAVDDSDRVENFA